LSPFEDFRRKAIELAQNSDGTFGSICEPFLTLMHSELNSYRRKGLIPEGEYRQKGNAFRDMLSWLINKRSGIRLEDRRVKGFTDIHDIDLVFMPDNVLKVAGEAKLLGTPAHLLESGEEKPERAGHVDVDKRLKEVKFTAVDLKLRYGGINVGIWDNWIANARPAFYSIWGCMVGEKTPKKIELLTRKFVELRKYNNGVGVLFYTEREGNYVRIRDTAPELDIDKTIQDLCKNLTDEKA